MKKKNRIVNRIISRGAALLVILSLCMPAAGCATLASRLFLPELYAELPTSEPSSTSSATPVSVPSEPEPFIPTEAPMDVTDLEYDTEIPVIHNDKEFNVLTNYHLRKRGEEFEFYAEDGFTIDNDLLLYRFSLPYVSTTSLTMEDNREFWTVYLYYYPGTLIADAYLTGDTSALSDEEIITYYAALDFIQNHVDPEPDVLKKEKLIHDFICESARYTNPPSSDMIPRHCTAVGLLLDGYANCQGYADCFDMLARMAGLKVDKQSGSAEGNLHVWNIINIEGNWYSMDITYNDTTFFPDGSGYPAYIYFNSGKDILLSTHSVPKDNELIPIIARTNDLYYYYNNSFSLKGSASDPTLAKEDLAGLLEECYEKGEKYVSYYVPGSILESSAIVNEIQSLIPGDPRRITITTYHVRNNTYILGEPR